MNREVLVIIPARGGSKGIPNKNIIPFEGLPLITHTIQAAQNSRYVTRTIVSTENAEIARVAQEFNADVPFFRPIELATDTVHASAPIIHALQWLESHEKYFPDLVVMLLPTSPLRQTRHIDEAIELYLDTNAPSVISVVKLDKQLPHLRTIDSLGALKPVGELAQPNVNRQNLPPLYALNGSIYVSSASALIEKKSFHVPGAIGYAMEPRYSIDINESTDLELASFYYHRNHL